MNKLTPPEGYELVPWDKMIKDEDRYWYEDGTFIVKGERYVTRKAEDWEPDYVDACKRGLKGGNCWIREIPGEGNPFLTLGALAAVLWRLRK